MRGHGLSSRAGEEGYSSMNVRRAACCIGELLGCLRGVAMIDVAKGPEHAQGESGRACADGG